MSQQGEARGDWVEKRRGRFNMKCETPVEPNQREAILVLGCAFKSITVREQKKARMQGLFLRSLAVGMKQCLNRKKGDFGVGARGRGEAWNCWFEKAALDCSV
jgi:hypothetical protein